MLDMHTWGVGRIRKLLMSIVIGFMEKEEITEIEISEQKIEEFVDKGLSLEIETNPEKFTVTLSVKSKPPLADRLAPVSEHDDTSLEETWDMYRRMHSARRQIPTPGSDLEDD